MIRLLSEQVKLVLHEVLKAIGVPQRRAGSRSALKPWGTLELQKTG
jgi:hypothetical protein